jgi:hypothetical protein
MLCAGPICYKLIVVYKRKIFNDNASNSERYGRRPTDRKQHENNDS